MNKKILMLIISSLTIVLLLPIGTSFASKPVDVTAVLYNEGEIVASRTAGNNVISERVLVSSFTSGNFEGDVYREATAESNLLLNSPNGPMIPFHTATIQQMLYVENAVVSVDSVVAEGSFVIKSGGKIGNVKWTIFSSDLTVDGEPVKMHGQGTVLINYFVIIDPTHYILENTLIGQVSFTS